MGNESTKYPFGKPDPSLPTQYPKSVEQVVKERRASAPLALLAANGYSSSEGQFFHVEGQVRNIGEAPLESVMVVATLYDGNGQFVKTAEALIDYNPILPGQTSPFTTITTGNPAIRRSSGTWSSSNI